MKRALLDIQSVLASSTASVNALAKMDFMADLSSYQNDVEVKAAYASSAFRTGARSVRRGSDATVTEGMTIMAPLAGLWEATLSYADAFVSAKRVNTATPEGRRAAVRILTDLQLASQEFGDAMKAKLPVGIYVNRHPETHISKAPSAYKS